MLKNLLVDVLTIFCHVCFSALSPVVLEDLVVAAVVGLLISGASKKKDVNVFQTTTKAKYYSAQQSDTSVIHKQAKEKMM